MIRANKYILNLHKKTRMMDTFLFIEIKTKLFIIGTRNYRN